MAQDVGYNVSKYVGKNSEGFMNILVKRKVRDKKVQLLLIQISFNHHPKQPQSIQKSKFISNPLKQKPYPFPNHKKMPKNIFPLHLIKVAQNTQIMVQLKSGQTYNGTLKGVDKFMNIKMESSIRTDSKGQVFHEVKDVYIRGNVLKYFTFENEAISKIQGTEYRPPENWKKSQNKDAKRLEKSKAKV